MIDREKLIKFFTNHCAIYNATACPKSSNGKCTIIECATCLADDFITNSVTVPPEPIKMVIPEGVDEKALIEMIRNAPIQILPGEPVQECEVGDVVYQTDGVRIYESKIKNVLYDVGHFAFDKDAIGKSVFLTYEEAEAVLLKQPAE